MPDFLPGEEEDGVKNGSWREAIMSKA